MKSAFLLDVVIAECATIFELLSSKDKSLLIGWNAFFILDLCLNIVNSICRFNIKSDGLASQGLNEDLHSTSKAQDKMEG